MDWFQKLENYCTVQREVAELIEVVKIHSRMYNRKNKNKLIYIYKKSSQ